MPACWPAPTMMGTLTVCNYEPQIKHLYIALAMVLRHDNWTVTKTASAIRLRQIWTSAVAEPQWALGCCRKVWNLNSQFTRWFQLRVPAELKDTMKVTFKPWPQSILIRVWIHYKNRTFEPFILEKKNSFTISKVIKFSPGWGWEGMSLLSMFPSLEL